MNLVAVGNYFGAHLPYASLFKTVTVLDARHSSVSDYEFKKDDVVLFGGGEDISPSLYQQKASRYSGATNVLSSRDSTELEIFKKAKKAGIPMLGICRGAQLLCALSGGSLYQHVNKHGTAHNVVTHDGREIMVSSVHHQMMNPFGTKHELIAWSKEILSNVHLIEGEKDIKVDIEPEVVYFPETKALAIQYHPEFMSENDVGYQYAKELVSEYLLKGK